MLRHRLPYLFAALLLSAAMAGGAVSAQAAEAGHLVFVAGNVTLAANAAKLNAKVQEGDELMTGADGYAYMKTVDGGFLILRPNSRARVIAYHIDTANPANTRVKLELLSGVARSISGEGVKEARQNFRFNTPVAAIGVRGTDFIVYTDQQTSRVAVVSGGVVMSGFDATCGPAGGGPCAGGRELYAGQPGMLLQVERGQVAPKLLHNPTMSPDQSAPPRGDEPVGKVMAPVHTLPVAEVSLDAQNGSAASVIKAVPPLVTLPTAGLGGGTTVSVTPTLPAPPPVGMPPVVVDIGMGLPVIVPVPEPIKPQPEIAWGRWQAVAGMAADKETIAKMNDGSYESGYILGNYSISRLKQTELVLPKEGTGSFVMAGGEATLQKTGGAALPATLENGSLNINFATRTFTTNVTVVSAEAKMQMQGRGDVLSKGQLYNSFLSPSLIRGYIGGAKADEAAYLFKTINDPAMTAEGAVRWQR